ncbi:MAG: M48 family metalloprotease [Vampirovibrionales bacterium]
MSLPRYFSHRSEFQSMVSVVFLTLLFGSVCSIKGWTAVYPGNVVVKSSTPSAPVQTAGGAATSSTTKQASTSQAQVSQVTSERDVAGAAILARLLGANALPETYPKRVTFTNENAFNAGTNGKNIVFTVKLWDALHTEDERAFVLSHELAHITRNHIPKSTARNVASKVLVNVISVASRSTLLSNVGVLGIQLLDLKFDRGQEYEADDYGLQMMRKAAYNPHASLAVFEVLRENSGGGSPEFLRTHPLSESRIKALLKKYPQPLSSL